MINTVARNRRLVSVSSWKVATLALCGRALGVVFHIESIPFGGRYRDMRLKPWVETGAGSIGEADESAVREAQSPPA